MNQFPVIKGAGYVLVHTPDMIVQNGSTQVVERMTNPGSEYLAEIESHIRSYQEVVSYAPNQTYIGNITPEELGKIESPWHDKKTEGTRQGKMGEIMPQDEFIGMLKMSDAFGLVKIDKDFMGAVKEKLTGCGLFTDEDIKKLGDGDEASEIEEAVANNGAEAIYDGGKLIGCVKKAHDRDINQRGGGNFAKSIAEAAGATNATGSDTRGFCAAPTHALIEAAALVQAGVYENVVIVAGGATAKLGMNGKDHVKKGLPVLEDVLGGFAIMIGKNDGVNPIVRTDLVGRHTVGTGSSPQAVITSLITAPLDKAGMKITDVDKYSVEMQNPDVTKPAGEGDVPTANYKMIGALGVKRGDIDKKELAAFVKNHGMPGWAPTQGHIPSGVPYLGFAKKDLSEGSLNRVMIVGKGSLFLGRMTNLFDGVSVIVERNPGLTEEAAGASKEMINSMIAEAMRGFASQMLSE